MLLRPFPPHLQVQPYGNKAMQAKWSGFFSPRARQSVLLRA